MTTADALKNFTCTKCGNCCRIPGYVRLTDKDVKRIANAMGLDIPAFTEKHTRLMPDRSGLALLEQPNGACAQLAEDGTCRIQSVKPEQCRNFPYTWRYPNMNEICEGWET